MSFVLNYSYLQTILKKSKKYLNRSFLAVFNVGRVLLISFFGLFLNYILKNYFDNEILNTYVYFISVFGLLYVFTNWGGKFFITKEISKNPNQSKVLISDLISSKLILVVLSVLVLVFIPILTKIKMLIFVFLFLKSLVPIFDSLILYRKKSKFVLVIEIILNSIFFFILFHSINTLSPINFLIYFVLFEFIKSCFFLIAFRKEISFKFSSSKGFNVLKKSFYFFGLSLVGFAVSKSDFYIVGILLDKHFLSDYFIISSLLSISMIIYATIINSFETIIFRLNKYLFNKLENALKFFGFIFSIFATIGFYLSTNFIYKISVDVKLSVLFFVNILFFTLVNFEMYRYTKLEKQKIVLIILIIASIINCALSFYLIQEFLLFGALFANTIGIVFNYLLLCLYPLKKEP